MFDVVIKDLGSVFLSAWASSAPAFCVCAYCSWPPVVDQHWAQRPRTSAQGGGEGQGPYVPPLEAPFILESFLGESLTRAGS